MAAQASISLTTLEGLQTTTLSTADEALYNLLSSFPANPTQADMINLQKAFQQWSLLVATISTSYKEVADALKGIVQKF